MPPPSGIVVRPAGGSVEVGLRRFGSRFQRLGPVTLGPELLVAPRGRSSRPWRLQLSAPGAFRIC